MSYCFLSPASALTCPHYQSFTGELCPATVSQAPRCHPRTLLAHRPTLTFFYPIGLTRISRTDSAFSSPPAIVCFCCTPNSPPFPPILFYIGFPCACKFSSHTFLPTFFLRDRTSSSRTYFIVGLQFPFTVPSSLRTTAKVYP